MSRKLLGLALVVAVATAASLVRSAARAQDSGADPFGGKDNPFAPKADESDENVGPLGIGAVPDEKNGTATAREVVAGGPADKAGLKAGEVLVGVDGAAFEPKSSPVLAIVAACEKAE